MYIEIPEINLIGLGKKCLFPLQKTQSASAEYVLLATHRLGFHTFKV